MSDRARGLNRRDFLHRAAGAALGASALTGDSTAAGQPAAEVPPEKLVWRNKHPDMTYRRLGRTNYMCSRLAAGWRGNNRLKRMLLEQGVNYFDTSRVYAGGNNEKEVGELARKFRDRMFLSSKASGLAGYPGRAFGRGEGAKAAKMYHKLLDTSLRVLKVDHLDCYYLHGVYEPFVLETEELHAAFEKARKAGKVKHNGWTTHGNVHKMLAKALELEEQGRHPFDLIMVACNPNSWPTLKDLIVKLQQHDVGLICMKATGQVRYGEGPRVGEMLKLADTLELNGRERSYAYMLHIANLAVLISEMQNVKHVEGNLKLPGMRLAAADRRRLEKMVVAELRNACHHCGRCAAACPEVIEVDDVLRYHSYYHNYGHHQDACGHFRALGYDLVQACSDCGRCRDACPAGIDLPAVIVEAARQMA